MEEKDIISSEKKEAKDSTASSEATGTSIPEATAKRRKSTNRVKISNKEQKNADEPVPQPIEGEDISFQPIELEGADEKKIEEEAISSLPTKEFLIDTLLYDTEETSYPEQADESGESYDSFFADYKEAIAETLAAARAERLKKEQAEVTAKGNESYTKDSLTSDEKLEEPIASDSEEGQYGEKDFEAESTQDSASTDFGDKETDEDGGEQLEFDLDSPEPPQLTSEEEASKEEEEKYNPEKPRRIDSIFEFVELFVFTLVAVMVITSFFLKHSVVDGSSMQNTLQDGEHLIISDFLYEPDYGDIIVFQDYSVQKDPLVKRVIALEGDTVKMTYNSDYAYDVYVNGELIDEDYVFTDGACAVINREWTVGEGEVFVLGDHRNNSSDSRTFGPIRAESILGKVILRFYPFDSFGFIE